MSRHKAGLSSLTDAELLDYCRRLYGIFGPAALTYTFLKSHHGLYMILYGRGFSQERLAEALGLQDELRRHMAGRPMIHAGRELVRRIWSQVVAEASEVAKVQGFLPPAMWFQKNSRSSIVQAVYNLDRTWDELRDAVGDTSSGGFVQSRNGMRWRSHPEASLSNFLHVRGIEHRRGDRYPKRYEQLAGKKHGRYDLHFLGKQGWVDVEVWGDNPGGHGTANYESVRNSKEHFNADNPRFLGIHFEDCFSEEKLTSLLKKHIGVIAPFRFDRPTDPVIPSTHWSNTDELLGYCRHFAANMPDGAFPTEEWLRKRGKWANRPGLAYNTLSIYIKRWFGGIRQLRKLLGQGNVSTNKWDHGAVLKAWEKFWRTHGLSPQQVRAHNARGIKRFSPEVVKEAARLCAAAAKHAGGSASVNAALDIAVDRKRKQRITLALPP